MHPVSETSPTYSRIRKPNVKGMMRNHRLARHLADASFGEFRRQLLYKGAQRGVQVVEVGRWYPSSKTCSVCGHLYRELKLSERV